MVKHRAGGGRAFAIAAAVVVSFATSTYAFANITAVDDSGRAVRLANPARRIVSLAPHVTELLFAAGAGEYVVGAVDYSDYPQAAKNIPRVGGGGGLDLEAIALLKPDLVVAWQSGNPVRQIERLRQMGLVVYTTEPREFEQIAHDIERLGRLAGTDRVARASAQAFRGRYRELQARYADRKPIDVFYQVLDTLLITVNGQHLISSVIRLCGGNNVFSDLQPLAPVIDAEAVLRANPTVIIASGPEALWRHWQERWYRWLQLRAVRTRQLYFISSDIMHRHTPRILDGAEQLCRALDEARR